MGEKLTTWNKRAMTKWYDKNAEAKEIADDQIVSVLSVRYKRIISDIERLMSLMSLTDDDRVLDAGCGAGRFIHRIRKTGGCQTFGIDTSRNMIERARKRVLVNSWRKVSESP